MNRHKYKKFIKKYKANLLKIRRERFAQKESTFKREIMMQLKEVEKFDAEAYVMSKLQLFRMPVLPHRIHGKVMPPFAVEEFLERRKAAKERYLAARERRRKFIEERGSLDVDIK